MQPRVFGDIADERVHIGCDGLRPSVHGGDGVTASLAAAPLEGDGTELQQGGQRGTPGMYPGTVAAENKDFMGCQSGV